MTYAEYCALPDDGNRYEVIAGELVLLPTPNRMHQAICRNLAVALGVHVKPRKLGHVYFRLDVVLSETNVVQPDLLFVSNARAGVLTEAGVSGAPDLTVEVLSDLTRSRDEVTKFGLYDKFGVGEYWIVDPDTASVRVHRRGEGVMEIAEGELTTPLLPGFAMAVEQIFTP